jgi:hypothetical protein
LEQGKMKNVDFGRCASGICMAAAMLAGCGGSQPPIGALGAMPQTSALATSVGRGKSWMRPNPYDQDLLYVATDPEAVFVYGYPKAEPHGTLGYFESPGPECSDKSGDVFVSTAQGLLEFAHDGASPIATLNTRGACSADPVKAKLAVCSGTAVSVFFHSAEHGWLLPRNYAAAFNVYNCGYDNKGNLFVDGVDKSNGFQFAELAAKGKSFMAITLNQNIQGPGQIQWDGRNIAIEDSAASPSVLYRFSISGRTGQEVGSTVLTGATMVAQFWIHRKKVVGSDGYDMVGIWDYPDGGSPVDTISVSSPYGVTVSVAPH